MLYFTEQTSPAFRENSEQLRTSSGEGRLFTWCRSIWSICSFFFGGGCHLLSKRQAWHRGQAAPLYQHAGGLDQSSLRKQSARILFLTQSKGTWRQASLSAEPKGTGLLSWRLVTPSWAAPWSYDPPTMMVHAFGPRVTKVENVCDSMRY